MYFHQQMYYLTSGYTLVSRCHCIKCGASQVKFARELKYMLRQVLVLNVVNHLIVETFSPLPLLT